MVTLGKIIKVTGYIVFAVTGIWGFFICLAIIMEAAGFWGIVIAFSIAPVTFTVAPFYAGLAWGNWFPLVLNYGGGMVGYALIECGNKLSRE